MSINPGINKKGSVVLQRATRPSNEFTLPELRKIATRLKKALKRSTNGIAIAANQVLGEDERIPSMFVHVGLIFLDPVYEIHPSPYFGPVGYVEGCLSDPGHEYGVVRHSKIVVKYKALDGSGLHERHHYLEGLTAQVFQHETDHLNGKTIF